MPRRNPWILLSLVLTAMLAVAWGANSLASQLNTSAGPPAQPAVEVRHPDAVLHAIKSDTSPPLRDIPPLRFGMAKWEDNDNPKLPLPPEGNVLDPVIQRALIPNAMPTPIVNFEGQYNQNGPLPPDTNGDVGRNHYFQIVNSTFQIWTKAGTSVYGPVNNNTLFTGFGGLCETRNDGDPIALYDAQADRWVVTWFTSVAPYTECVAVTTSPDPMGSWYRYAFPDNNPGTTFGDYPHMSVWPDAYYMTTNEFNGGSGGGNYAYDRAKMLRGDPTAGEVYFHTASGGMQPSDLEGAGTPPPAGSPAYFLRFSGTTTLQEYKFHVDFATPGNSTFTGPFAITVASFSSGAPSVPQPGTTTLLDTLSDRLMFRLSYRNMGSYESLLVNHTVNASGVDGIRWYELRDPNNPSGASVFQQGTYAPGDGIYRWMGSIAMDRAGDIALGFSASSSTVTPNIRYAGRLVGDPAGQLSQGEAVLFPGVGSEDFPSAHRWGDYSAMQVDPVDDCTFWYTQMYWGPTGLRDWRTRIGSFKFPSCTAQGTPTPVATATGAVPTATHTPGPSPTYCPGNIVATDSITNTDPTQTGRLGLSDPKSSCAVPKTAAASSDSLTRHYKSYTYTNTSGSAQCVTVSITQACGNNAVQSITYLGSFDPSNPATNYLADGGAAGPSSTYSFSLGAGQTAVVVVNETSPNLGCSTYTIAINPCGAAGATNTPTPAASATPTRTSTPATATPTACGVPPNWVAGPTRDPARDLFQGASANDGKFYVAGGQDSAGTVIFNDVSRYNPTSNAWEAVTTLPVPVGQDAVGSDGGKLFVAGGYIGNNSITSTLQIYNIATNTWTFGAPMPASVEAAGGEALNGKFYVIGGDDFSTTSLRSTYIYDIASNTWTTGPQIPDVGGRTNTNATAAGGKIYVFGGAVYDGSSSTAVDTMLAYDPGTSTWTTLASANTGGEGNYASVSPYGAGKLLVTDGGDGGFNPVATTHIYDIASNTYTAGPTQLVARLGHAQDTLPDGRVIVYGGQSTGGTTPTLENSSELLAQPAACNTATPTVAPTNTPTNTPTAPPATATSGAATATATTVAASVTPGAASPTTTPVGGSPTATPTECPISFSDVHPTDYFYEPVRYLYCHGVISGYGDGTFRPYNDTTRAQMVKIVVLGFGIPVVTPAGGAYTFHDVPPAAPFFDVIETAAAHNIISGYNCGPGGPGPCDPQNRGYFLPNNPVTRGQLSKIDVIAAGWPQLNPTTPTFTDVPQANPFYTVIETAVCHGVVSGYADHTFHPFANATRGQISKIVYLSLLNGPGSCALTPAAR